ncbi:aminopeptidase [Ophidiomyces ophidiicola]|uniref:Aminopeptidase n=1 Tax=Ophidiomyces ophidiicola TaxID=1387563 RepID=A0ACB8UNI0_9EURO|nr:aminopeptidase [Ophidiomyces ophidiicola]KAI1906298.1 aminopeptidase [Ophidiomyces ophidiicola]KAI1941485.1 aminopeptidase [Ophidiomyces ophidiicola]KAI1941628.1 aminopeptidase [Ophidiomyces ophidiicola]KAI1961678.1 aminopeptidase [Ophidiomyces ophidiicola]KAI2001891.1 aminopeptidase [Ophidiomyces ophidiicola]
MGSHVVTPGVTAFEYAHRRAKLAAKLPKNGIAIIRAAEVKYKAKSVFYEYHQNPDFYYLTGFNEPGALAVIAKNESDDDYIFHLYVREKDPRSELWQGARSGTQAALDVFNADETGDIEQIKDILPSIVSDASEIFTDVKGLPAAKSAVSRFFPSMQRDTDALNKTAAISKIKPLQPLLSGLRVFKSEGEIENMRKAGKASGRAFTEAMKHNFTTEKDLYAFLEYQIKINGCEQLAFVPVVAGGQNALSIHYVRNDDVLRDGSLVLVDGGGSYGGYVSDITRTWPVNGKFTDPQRDLYTAVLNVQRECVGLCCESQDISLDEIHSHAESQLSKQLTDLGFEFGFSNLTTSGSHRLSIPTIKELFPHHVGHYVGLDVHDTGSYSRRHKLRKGQCITIEPGIYVPNDERWPEHFRGIGIRIEDSVCIGGDHPLVLTTEAVKEVNDIEALRP